MLREGEKPRKIVWPFFQLVLSIMFSFLTILIYFVCGVHIYIREFVVREWETVICMNCFFVTQCIVIIVFNLTCLIAMAALLRIDKGDLYDVLDPLNGFPGCYEYPYVYFDLRRIKHEFNRSDVQWRGKWFNIIIIFHCLIIAFFMIAYCLLSKEQSRIE